MRRILRSVGVYGGANVLIHTQSSKDTGRQILAASVPDLSTEPYGTGGSFGGRVIAAWIYSG